MKKRLLSVLLAMCMMLTILPTSALAKELELPAEQQAAEELAESKFEEVTKETLADSEMARDVPTSTSGTCGDSLTWTLDNGILTIRGSGKMQNSSYSPWYNERASIKVVRIENGMTHIGDNAFEDCSSLINVTIPDSVTSIGYQAFYGCSKLESVIIPNSVISLGDDAFAFCRGLRSATISNSITTIGRSTFYLCDELINVIIPDSVTSIGYMAFSSCKGLANVTIPDSVISIGEQAFASCSGLTSVTISDSVISIGNSAFAGCSKLTSVTIPSSVTSIGRAAFSRCSGLASVAIPNSVTSIGSDAFADCSGLSRVTIPSSITNIEEHTFARCSGMTSVIIPSSITSIGAWAFDNCSVLRAVYFAGTEDQWNDISINNSGNSYLLNASIHYEDTTPPPPIVETPTSGTCGKNLTWLFENNTLTIDGFGEMDAYKDYNYWHTESVAAPWYSFRSSIKEVKIGNGVTSIGNFAFNDCSNLISIAIPSSVSGIGEEAFRACGSLTSITLPDGVTTIGSYAFLNCSNLTKVAIPSSVINIGSYIFGGCDKLTNAGPIGGGYNYEFGWTEKIPAGAFSSCKNLNSITIPNSIIAIALGNDCPISYVMITGNGELERISGFPQAFGYDVDSIIVDIADGITRIGEEAFRGSSRITHITIPNSVTSIGNQAFYSCRDLTSIVIPNSVTSIESWAFSGCSGLTSVTIPDNVTSIGDYAFYSCSGLTNVTILSSVISIRYGTFYGCSNLTSVTIPNSVTSIDTRAFYDCSDLTDITIPDSVTFIGGWAFDGCNKLTDVYYSGTKNQWNAISIGSSNDSLKNATIHYAGGTDEPSAPDIGSGNFGAENDNLSWTLDANGVLTIRGNGVMDNFGSSYAPWYDLREQVKALRIESGVTNIGNWAFRDCANLTSASIADSVNSIGMGTFYGCSGLKNVSLPNGIATISAWTFQKCGALQYAVIPDSVTSVQDYVFDSCGNLSDIYYPGTAEQWKGITIAQGNDPLLKAAVHYNSTGPDDSGDDILGWGSEDTQWTMEVGKKLTLTVQMADGSFIDDSKLTWTLDPAFGTAKIIDHGPQDEKTAYVTLEGVSPGKVTLRGTLAVGESILDYPTISQEITVIGQENIRFDQETYSVKEGEVIDNITVSVPNPNGLTFNDINFNCISSDSETASVTSWKGPDIDSGLNPILVKVGISGLNAGTATITASVGDGRSASCAVIVGKKADVGFKPVIGQAYPIKVGNSGRSYAPVPLELKGKEISWEWKSSNENVVSFSKDEALAEMSKEETAFNTISEIFHARSVGTATLTCSIDGNKIYSQEVTVEALDSKQPTIESNDYEAPQNAAQKFEKYYNKLEVEYKKFTDGVQDVLDHPGKYQEDVTDPSIEEQARALLEHDIDKKSKNLFLQFSPISTPSEVKLCCYEVFCEQLYRSAKEAKFSLKDISLNDPYQTELITKMAKFAGERLNDSFTKTDSNGRTITIESDFVSYPDNIGNLGTMKCRYKSQTYTCILLPSFQSAEQSMKAYLQELIDLEYRAQKNARDVLMKEVIKFSLADLTNLKLNSIRDKMRPTKLGLEALQLNGLDSTVEDCYNYGTAIKNIKEMIDKNPGDINSITTSIEGLVDMEVPNPGQALYRLIVRFKGAQKDFRENILKIYNQDTLLSKFLRCINANCPVSIKVYKGGQQIGYVSDDDIW